MFRYLVAPAVRELLAAGLRPRARDWLLAAFELLYNALWLCPAYVMSLVVNTLWCGFERTFHAAVSSAHICAARWQHGLRMQSTSF